MGRGCVSAKQNNSSINNGTNTRGGEILVQAFIYHISCSADSDTILLVKARKQMKG